MQERAKRTVKRLLLLAASVGVGALCWFLIGDSEKVTAAEPPPADVLARYDGAEVTAAEVHELAAGELLKLDRNRHELIAEATRSTVRNRLLEAEAKKRGVSRQELLDAEVKNKVGEISQEEVDAFYEENKSQIRAPKPQVLGQIQQFLAQQRAQQLYETFITGLEKEHKVEYFIAPFRVEVAATGPSKGSAEAPVTIVEFSDFQCPFCTRVLPTLQQIRETYGGKVRIVFRQFPLDIHPQAPKAAEASLCADDQGKFWEMHDRMFGNQSSLDVAGLKTLAGQVSGLDAAKFAECLDSGKHAEQVKGDLEAGQRAGVSSTPAFFINGRLLSGAEPFEKFAEIIDDELARQSG